jgi:hypothetical protein
LLYWYKSKNTAQLRAAVDALTIDTSGRWMRTRYSIYFCVYVCVCVCVCALTIDTSGLDAEEISSVYLLY